MSTETETETETRARVRVLTPSEAFRANEDAHTEFVNALDRYNRDHLVSNSALKQWYRPRPRTNRAAAIAAEFGPAVSTRLEKR